MADAEPSVCFDRPGQSPPVNIVLGLDRENETISPYHREIYAEPNKTYVLFCNGNPRSALSAKALQDMGVANVAQLSGGMPAWKEAGGPTVEKARK